MLSSPKCCIVWKWWIILVICCSGTYFYYLRGDSIRVERVYTHLMSSCRASPHWAVLENIGMSLDGYGRDWAGVLVQLSDGWDGIWAGCYSLVGCTWASLITGWAGDIRGWALGWVGMVGLTCSFGAGHLTG
ncbi:hypothetical protein Hanom_Chr13g01182381 [Helianthus anomalus]